MTSEKPILIIGSLNAVTYNDIFKLIRANKLWLGYGFQAGNAYFAVPNPGDYAKGVYDEATGGILVGRFVDPEVVDEDLVVVLPERG